MVRHSPRAQDSRLTIAVDGRSPGDLYNLGEACLAPTQICPLLDRYGVRGRFRAPFPFTPAHNRRKSVQSAVWYRLCPEHSRSTIGVDGRSPGGLYNLGEAYLAPTQICPLLDRYGVRGRFRAPFPFAPAHNRRKSVQSAVWYRLCPEHSRSTIGVDGRSPGDLYNLGEACLAPTQICPLLDRYGVRGRFRAPLRIRRSIRGRPMVVHLIFITWARRASPYTDTPPTGPVWCAWAFQGAVPVHNRRKSVQSAVWYRRRSTIGVDVVNLPRTDMPPTGPGVRFQGAVPVRPCA